MSWGTREKPGAQTHRPERRFEPSSACGSAWGSRRGGLEQRVVGQADAHHLPLLAERFQGLVVQEEPQPGSVADQKAEARLRLPPHLLARLKEILQLLAFVDADLEPGRLCDLTPQHVLRRLGPGSSRSRLGGRRSPGSRRQGGNRFWGGYHRLSRPATRGRARGRPRKARRGRLRGEDRLPHGGRDCQRSGLD